MADVAVAVVYRFSHEGIAIYDRHVSDHAEVLTNQPARRSHVCYETEDGFTVVDVWDSAEDFEAFGDVLSRVANESVPGEGEARTGPIHLSIHTVHNLIV